jgi:microcystin-dependent protein
VATSYVGEIKMGGWNFAPAGWAFCDGQLMSIAQNEVLFNLIGTTYGGDGQSTFALPDLRGRLPVHVGPGLVLAQAQGTETVTLNGNQVPMHSHPFECSTSQAGQNSPTGYALAALPSGNAYVQDPPTAALASASIGSSGGGGQPHNNLQPYLCVTFVISLYGIYPTPT